MRLAPVLHLPLSVWQASVYEEDSIYSAHLDVQYSYCPGLMHWMDDTWLQMQIHQKGVWVN
jgi:hypothetical protein